MQRVMDFVGDRKVGYLKTDIEGFGLKALSSLEKSGLAKANIEFIKSEAWLFNKQAYGVELPFKVSRRK